MQHRTAREDLAAALRWAARLGWQSAICNHFSLAVEEAAAAPAGVLINPQGLHWSEVTASSLLLLDLAGQIVEGTGEVETTAFYLHYGIHSRVPRARAILHAHPPHATALMCREEGRLLNCHQDSLRFHGRIAYDDDFGGVASDEQEGARLAAALGNRSVLMMAHHGVTVTAPTLAEALDDFYNLELAARFQILAESGGHRLKIIDPAHADRLAPGFQAQEAQTFGHFAAIRRILDREEPDYRD